VLSIRPIIIVSGTAPSVVENTQRLSLQTQAGVCRHMRRIPRVLLLAEDVGQDTFLTATGKAGELTHFNCGLWDLYGWRYHEVDRSPTLYEKRLETLVHRLKQIG
jgi:hypothetical protein